MRVSWIIVAEGLTYTARMRGKVMMMNDSVMSCPRNKPLSVTWTDAVTQGLTTSSEARCKGDTGDEVFVIPTDGHILR